MSQFYHIYDTIAAIATPPGEGGIAIIRISGPDAIVVGDRVFSGPVSRYASHTAHCGQIRDAAGQVVDEALLLVMLGGRSFTGDPTVEVHCHGGALITKRVLETVLAAGARLAQPGEFTYRAFVNGKLDLAQAEAVQALIGAKSALALSAASDQLQGRVSERVRAFQRRLIDVAAVLEAWVDFPEEGLEFTTFEELLGDLRQVVLQMRHLADTFHHGRVMREGASLCLAGCPNVGKSSLMNALLDQDRAIVTPIAGTTRDLIEETVRLGALHFRLVDTAGIRTASDLVEQEGIRRSREAMERADIVLLVLDAARALGHDDRELLNRARAYRTVVIWNKSDLVASPPEALDFSPVISVSATQRRGFDELQNAIERLLFSQNLPSRDEVVLTHARHHEALERAIEACQRTVQGLEHDLSPEFLCIEMREALVALSSILGQEISEEILSAIFARFCLGK